jgi:hypothetical protein
VAKLVIVEVVLASVGADLTNSEVIGLELEIEA